MPVDEVSIGDYVLAGGEAAVLVIVEAVARLLPGVLGNPESLAEESHAGGLLECPVYTRPPSWHGLEVPERAAVRRPRRDRPLAAGRVAAPHRAPAALTCSSGADLGERDRAAAGLTARVSQLPEAVWHPGRVAVRPGQAPTRR